MAAYVMEFGGDSLTDSCGSSDQTFVFHHVLGCCFVGLLAAFSRLPLPSLFENRKVLTLLKAPIYVPQAHGSCIAFPLQYSPKVYQSTEQVYYYA